MERSGISGRKRMTDREAKFFILGMAVALYAVAVGLVVMFLWSGLWHI
jgi:hypothetical protein